MDKDEKLARNIWKQCLQRSSKPFKWLLNFNTIKTIPSGTAFRIEGKVKGWVEIRHKKQYAISIIPDNEAPIIFSGVKIDGVVSTIENAINSRQGRAAI